MHYKSKIEQEADGDVLLAPQELAGGLARARPAALYRVLNDAR